MYLIFYSVHYQEHQIVVLNNWHKIVEQPMIIYNTLLITNYMLYKFLMALCNS